MAPSAKKATKAQKASQTKTAKTKTTAPATATAAKKQSPVLIAGLIAGALIGGALIVGLGLGTMNTNQSSSSSGAVSGDMDGQIEAYIRANPGLIMDVLTTYNRDLANQERQQGINLVKLDDGNTVLGNPDGDITIYEFSDYNCGYCKRAFNNVKNLIAADDNIRVVIKEFPILSETSKQAAEISMAAAELGKFDEVHSALMTWQGRLDDNAFNQILADNNLDRDAINAIIAKGEIEAKLSANRNAAQAIKVSGTPAFVIGNTIVPGAISSEEMAQIVAQERANTN